MSHGEPIKYSVTQTGVLLLSEIVAIIEQPKWFLVSINISKV